MVKLTDFGLSTKIEPFEQGHKLYLGTPEYMAPEITVQEGSPVFESRDHSTLPYVSFPVDIWSIGIVTYELITGHLLYSSLFSVEEMLKEIRFKDPSFDQKLIREHP